MDTGCWVIIAGIALFVIKRLIRWLFQVIISQLLKAVGSLIGGNGTNWMVVHNSQNIQYCNFNGC